MRTSAKSSTRTRGGRERHRALRSARLHRALALSALGLAGVTLAACGSASSASSPSSTAAPSNRGGGTGTGGTGSGAGGTPRQFPGASGTIAAINGASLEVQNPNSGQTTVTYTAATAFQQTVSAAAADVVVGSCLSAFGKPSSSSSSTKQAFGRPITATTVTISQPASGSCTAGFGGFTGGGANRGATGGTPPTGVFPQGGSGERPPRSGNFRGRGRGSAQFGAASGSVTSVTGSTVNLAETNPRTKATSTVVVTLDSATTYTERTAASASDLMVGKCAQAVGKTDTTGALTANSITLSAPVSGSCTARFGGFGGGAGRAGAAAPGSTGVA